MRIIHIVTTINPRAGGVSSVVCQVCGSLVNFKHIVVTTDLECFDLGLENASVINLGNYFRIWGFSQRLKSWLLRNVIATDVIVVHGIWQYHSYAVRRFIESARRRGSSIPKVYIMLHGMLDPWFQQAPERRWKALRNEVYWRLIERENINRADGLLFTCQAELELARTTFKGYRPIAEHNIGYGIPAPPTYSPAMNQAFRQLCAGLSERPYLLFLSRIHPKKGLDLLLSAYGAILSAAPDPNAIPHLVVAGPGAETAYGQKCLAIIAANPLMQQRVHLAGMLSGDAKWGALYGAEAFVLPSHQENFGIAVVEALACGTPVLISNKVNIFQEIQTAGAGFAEDDTLEGTEKLLQRWATSEVHKRKLMAKHAVACYQASFSIDQAAKKMFQVISG